MFSKRELVSLFIIHLIGFGYCADGQTTAKAAETIGKDCKITEPYYNITFDLSSLRKENGYKIVGFENDKLDFNICGKLKAPCGDAPTVAACLEKKDKRYKFGLENNGEPVISNGVLSFNFKGDTCKENKSYTLTVILTCDYHAGDKNEPDDLMPYKEDDCMFLFFWRTKHACQILTNDLVSNACTVADPQSGHIFDLSPLSHKNDLVPYHDNKNLSFVVSICKPVIYMYDALCPPGTSICLVNDRETDVHKKYVNVGSTIANPVFENGELLMHFPSNEKCTATENFASVIDFNCVHSTGRGGPEYLGLHGCTHRFLWETPHACKPIKNCFAYHPRTNYAFDFSSLSGKRYELKTGNESYMMGICTPPKQPCLENAGICQTTNGQTASLGVVNADLVAPETEAPYLLYASGSACESIQKQWKTKIEFLCEEDVSKQNIPKVIENKECLIIVQFPTKLACQDQITCRAYDDDKRIEYDLTPLINSKENYLAKINETLAGKKASGFVYYLNVCRPLVPQYHLGCKGNTATCRAVNISNELKNEKSLGFPKVSLTMVDTHRGARPQLKYLNGDVCTEDPQNQFSSLIEFYCDPKAGKGVPILQEIVDSCEYVFHWGTNVVCAMHVGTFRDKTCEIYNEQVDKALDLRTIIDKGILNAKYKTTSLTMNVCEHNRRVEINYVESTVQVFFDAKGPCGDGKADETVNVELRIVCKDAEDWSYSTPTTSCGYVFIKETPLICSYFGIIPQPVNEPAATVVDDNGSVLGTMFITLITLAAIGSIIFVVWSPERRARVISLFRRRPVSVQYSRVHNDEEASLLMQHPSSLSDSDDDLLI